MNTDRSPLERVLSRTWAARQFDSVAHFAQHLGIWMMLWAYGMVVGMYSGESGETTVLVVFGAGALIGITGQFKQWVSET